MNRANTRWRRAAATLAAILAQSGASVAAAATAAPTPIMVADVNTGNGPVRASNPHQYARLNATQTVFAAYDQVHGEELWITDGTAAHTHLLYDFCPGACSSTPVVLNRANAVARGVLYVAADDGTHGAELWKVTSAGVVSFVKDINPGALGSQPGQMAFPAFSASSPGYFAATTSANGTELWKTDGTAAGTVLVKDIVPGPDSSFPGGITGGLNRVYFSATTADTGTELYMSDGTPGGTALRADIRPGPDSSAPAQLIDWLNDTMIFVADDGASGRELWITTPTTTTQLKDIAPGAASSNPGNLTGFAGQLYFTACPDSGSNCELWTSDGSSGGTAPFKDICVGSCSSSPRRFATLTTAAGPRMLFFANPTGGNASLYASDGTVGGTVPILATGAANPLDMVVSGGLVYFTDTTDLKLFRSDATVAGSFVVHDFATESFLSIDPSYRIGPVGTNKILFGADDGFVGDEPYVLGPSVAASAPPPLKNIAADLGYGDPTELTDVNGTLYFAAYSETTGRELWKVADPSAGAVLVADLVPGATPSNPHDLTAFGGKLYFAAIDPVSLLDVLYVSDGSPGGTHPLRNVVAPDLFEYRDCLSVVGNRMYFNAADAGGEGPWASDGTDAGTVNLNPGGLGEGLFCSAREPGYAAAGAQVLFQADDPTRGYELFRTSGAAGSATFVRDIVPGAGSLNSSAPSDFVSLGNIACFSVGQGGDYGEDDLEPWCSDGTAQGTVPLGDLNPGFAGSRPLSLTRVGAYLAFTALSPTLGRRLWRSDGTSAGTAAFDQLNPGMSFVRDFQTALPDGGSPDPPPLEHAGPLVYFACTDVDGALCRQDIRPGRENNAGIFGTAGGVTPDQLHVFPGGDALMACATAATGRELCRFNSAFDGVAIQAIDVAIVDLAPGAESSSPDQITPSGAYVYFTADDGTHGRELWAVPLRDTIDRLFHDGFD